MQVPRMLLVVAAGSLQACFNLPARDHTFAVDGERVDVAAIDLARLCGDPMLRESYAAAFFNGSTIGKGDCEARASGFERQSLEWEALPSHQGEAKLTGVGSAIAIQAATFLAEQLFDYVSEELEREADTYEADFSAQLTGEKFYDVNRTNLYVADRPEQRLEDLEQLFRQFPQTEKPRDFSAVTKVTLVTHKQRVYGFTLTRSVKATSDHECLTRPHAEPGRSPNQQALQDRAVATAIDFGIYYSKNNALMQFAPLRYVTHCSKAKLPDPSGLVKLFKPSIKDSDRLFTEITLNFEGFVYDPVKHQFMRVPLLSGQKYTVPSYSMIDRFPIRQPEIGTGTGWMQPVPFSGSGDGAYAVSISVYEKDPSNAKKYITKAQSYVTRKRKEIITEIEEKGDRN